ncbi:hypothetical protein [Streptomyces dysideae]|uniref:hypothetical protein n=1 Tax=Streptomyces dysideae TaxID=909626 RepID=UPI00131AB988|nr:hypothetical protein [Streptomyces dysideae]
MERVQGIPHGAKLIIDEPEGEVGVVWVDEDELDGDIADLIAERLTEFSWPLAF